MAKEAIVKRYNREKYQISSKIPLWDFRGVKDYISILDNQLKRMDLEYFDVYLLHSLNEEKLPLVDKNGGWEFLKLIKQKGQARYIGFSFHSSALLLDRILKAHPEIDVVQLQINYVDWENEQVQSRLCYETARKHGKPVIIMEPIKGGYLTTMDADVTKILKNYNSNASPASWAIRYCATLDGIITVLSGMSNLEQIDENTNIAKNIKPLSHEERKVLEDVVRALNQIPIIECTYCKYCIEHCPKRINIPMIISILNDYKKYNALPLITHNYMIDPSLGGKPNDCLQCKACESSCSQHIEIINCMSQAPSLFKNRVL